MRLWCRAAVSGFTLPVRRERGIKREKERKGKKEILGIIICILYNFV